MTADQNKFVDLNPIITRDVMFGDGSKVVIKSLRVLQSIQSSHFLHLESIAANPMLAMPYG